MEQPSYGSLVDLMFNREQEREQERVKREEDPKVLLQPENRKIIENFYWHMILAEKRDRVSEQRIILHDCAGFKVLNSLKEGNISENSLYNIISRSKTHKRMKISGAKQLSVSFAKHLSKYMMLDQKNAHKYRGGVVYVPGEKFNEIYDNLVELLLINNQNVKVVRNHDFLRLIDYNERKFCDAALGENSVNKEYLKDSGISNIEKLLWDYSSKKMIKPDKKFNYSSTDKGRKYLDLQRKLEFKLIYARKIGEAEYQRKQLLGRVPSY